MRGLFPYAGEWSNIARKYACSCFNARDWRRSCPGGSVPRVLLVQARLLFGRTVSSQRVACDLCQLNSNAGFFAHYFRVSCDQMRHGKPFGGPLVAHCVQTGERPLSARLAGARAPLHVYGIEMIWQNMSCHGGMGAQIVMAMLGLLGALNQRSFNDHRCKLHS
jgi:hypothetical protein